MMKRCAFAAMSVAQEDQKRTTKTTQKKNNQSSARAARTRFDPSASRLARASQCSNRLKS
jgi:hypothetical protein